MVQGGGKRRAVIALGYRGISYCFECKRPLVEIDNRGRHLRGCLTCNDWRDSAGNVAKLSVEDLAALHALPRT